MTVNPTDSAAPTLQRPASAEALLTGVVDYAGLFPPAALSMPEAIAEYARARHGADRWMLGRFITTAARLSEMQSVLASAAPAGDPWLISAIVRDQSEADAASIATFNGGPVAALAHVDAIESKPEQLEGVDWLAQRFGNDFGVYVEIALDADLDLWMARLAARGLRAKIRTGGVTAAAFPAPAQVVAFIHAALRADVPFKATAGLHHAVRGSYRLTYEPGAVEAPMYGYLNVLLATAALRTGESTAVAEQLLTRTDAAALAFDATGVRWGSLTFPDPLLRMTRAHHLVGFGSCSFREPADEARALTTR